MSEVDKKATGMLDITCSVLWGMLYMRHVAMVHNSQHII